MLIKEEAMEDKKFIKGFYNGMSINLIFDKVYKEWMQKLIDFMKRVGREQGKYNLCLLGESLIQRPEYSFLGTSTAVASQFFYFLMKDELSEATQNFALDFLCKYISTNEETETVDDNEIRENREYMIDLATQKHNEMLTGQIYDFYVSMWSCFETAITSITAKYELEIRKKLSNSRLKKVKKIYKRNSTEACSDIIEHLKESIDKEFPIYISFPDRINYLLDEVIEDYKRDKKKDKEILLYAAALRNTVHNNGVHLKANKELEISGYKFKLEQNNKVYYERFTEIMILVNEIFNIYCEILRFTTQYVLLDSQEEK